MNIITYFFLIIILLAACQPINEEAQQDPTPQVFFDIKGYFNQEVQRLNTLQPQVTKTVAINQKKETKQWTNLNYQPELEVFAQADINRLDWVDKYSVDSTFQNNRLTGIEYKALEDKLRTRHIRIQFKNGNVSNIRIENGGKNMAAGSQQELEYEPSNGYYIKSVQHTTLFKDKIFKINVIFKKE